MEFHFTNSHSTFNICDYASLQIDNKEKEKMIDPKLKTAQIAKRPLLKAIRRNKKKQPKTVENFQQQNANDNDANLDNTELSHSIEII